MLVGSTFLLVMVRQQVQKVPEQHTDRENQRVVLGISLEIIHDTVRFQVIHLYDGCREFERVEFLADPRVFFDQILLDFTATGK